MTLTLDALRKVMDELPEPPINPLWDRSPLRVGGIDIFEVPARIVPVLRIRDEVPCREDVRREVNDYLLRTFGTRDESVVPKGYAYLFGSMAIMRPETAVMLKNFA